MNSNSDLFSSTLSLSSHEISSLIARLESLSLSQFSQRFDCLKGLRTVLKRNGNHVPFICQQPLFLQLNDIFLREKHSKVIEESLWLLVDIIAGTPHLDQLTQPLIPIVVTFLGDESSDVRRAALRLLHVHMRHTLNLQKSLSILIEYGINGNSKEVQKGVVLSLPLLFGEEFSNENLFSLVDSLLRLLIRADNQLFYPVFLALQRFHSILGNQIFQKYLNSAEIESKQLYESILSRNPTPDSLQDVERRTLLERPLIESSSKTEKTLKFEKSFDSIDSEDNDFCPPILLRFGLFPSALIHSAMNGSSDERLAAIEAILAIIRETPLQKLVQLLPQMQTFLSQLIGGQLLEQNSFKVTLASLDIIESLVERLKSSMTPFLPTIINVLAKRLGDQRTVVRDSVIKVIHHLMYSFPPQELLDILLSEKPSKNPKIREEIINRVSAAVLTFPRQEFNLAKLSFSVSPMLTDNRRMVRLAALECLSVLAQALGPKRLSPLLAAVEAIEQNCQLEGLQRAVQQRLSRRQLPRCGGDGIIRYVLNPQQFNGWFSSLNEADLEWVMMASPSSNNGTPPKTLKENQNKSSIPLSLTSIPFDRRKSHNFPQFYEDFEEMGKRKSIALENIDHLLTTGQTVSTERERILDQFRGVSFNSEEEEGERRGSQDSNGSGLEVWRQYFSRFRKQLAEAAFCGTNLEQNDNEFKGLTINSNPNKTRSDLNLNLSGINFAQDLSDSRLPLNPNHSPQHSSSAPSTASGVGDGEHVTQTVRFFHEEIKEEEQRSPFEVPFLERSMSLPSIQRQIEEEEEEELEEEENKHEKLFPSPFLMTPTIPTKEEEEEEENSREEKNHSLNEPSSEPPVLSVQEATPLHHRRSSSVTEPQEQQIQEISDSKIERLDVWTQKDETLSSETSVEENIGEKKRERERKAEKKSEKLNSNLRRKRAQPLTGRQSRSQSPQGRRRPSRPAQQIYIKTTPAIPLNANIRHILGNVAKTEGPFDSPQEAVKAALMALNDDAWTTKVEGMLAVTRLATFHSNYLLRDQHLIVGKLILEVKNLRSTVARSAIFTLGELFLRLKTQIEPEMDSIVSSLLQKSGENIVFMREDIERSLMNCLEEMPQTRTALALIQGGANHRNGIVRRTCAQFLSLIVERMGTIKCLLGPRDICEHLLPSASRFIQDQSPHTRFYGRKIFSILINHSSFEKLLRKHVTPGTYRNIVGILEAIKRRGIGDRPQDLSSPQ